MGASGSCPLAPAKESPGFIIKGGTMARYGKKASEKVEKAMHERKRGKLKSGRSGKTVKSRKQAIAIGLSEARRAGGKVPSKKSSSKKSSSKKSSSRKSPAKKKWRWNTTSFTCLCGNTNVVQNKYGQTRFSTAWHVTRW